MTVHGRSVVVTGIGAVTAFGSGVAPFWRGLLQGSSAIDPVSLFDASRYQARRAGEVRDVSSSNLRERAHELALRAAAEAVAGYRGSGGTRFGVVTGTSLGGNRLWTQWLSGTGAADALRESTLFDVSRVLAESCDARGPVSAVSVACASGTAAIGLGAEWIRRGDVDTVLAGGYDALSEFVFAGFDSLRALSVSTARPFDARRDGLALGEGAGFLLLEARETALREGREPLATISGYGSASDAHHMTRPPSTGEGLARALTAALGDAGLEPSSVGFVSAHGTATVFNDRMEAAAFRAIFGEALSSLPVNSIKGAIGHTLGAAGALEAVMAVEVLRTSLIPPTAGCENLEPGLGLDIVLERPRVSHLPIAHVVSTSAAFGGTNAALVVSRA